MDATSFAPVAAHLSCGLPLKQLGRELKDFVQLPWPTPTKHGNEIRGEIVHIDHFGNAITNIESKWVGRKMTFEVFGKRRAGCALADFYGAVPAGSPVAVIGSSGFGEIAVNGGSAANRFGLKPGDVVNCQTK